VVVTGCTGFVGSHLMPALAKAGYDTSGTVEPDEKSDVVAVELFPVDVCTGNGLTTAFQRADVVVHLAARNHVLRETAKDPLTEYRRVNVDGTRNVLRVAISSGVKGFVHMSSIKAMGEMAEGILTENDKCDPRTPYGISKHESEELVRSESRRGGMWSAILRLPMVYGPGNKGNLPRMIGWADRGLPFPLVQPENLRSMVYVGNVVAGVLAVIQNFYSESATQRIFFVKDDVDCSTRMIYSSICRELGKTPRFIRLPPVLGRIAGGISEDFRKVTSSFRVSSAKIREEIGFMPPVSGEEGIARTVQWYKRSVQ